MYINLNSLNQFLKKQGLPVVEQMSETPIEKNDYSDGTEGSFFFSLPDEDIRDMPPFVAEEWTPEKNHIEWISVNAAWDENSADWKDEEKSLHHFWGRIIWDNVSQKWKEGGKDKKFGEEERQPTPLGECLTKPFVRTIQWNENCIPALYNASSYNFVNYSSDEEYFLVERINILHENEEPDDILLLHTFQTIEPKGAYRAVLIVYDGVSKNTKISYIGFPVYKGDLYVNEHLRDMFAIITGIRFIPEFINYKTNLVFPHISDSFEWGKWVHSTLAIANDIMVPAFFSFNLPEITETDEVDSDGAIGSPWNHDAVGFLMRKNQKLPLFYYQSENYLYADFRDDRCPERNESAVYATPVINLPDEYIIRMLSFHSGYTEDVTYLGHLWICMSALENIDDDAKSGEYFEKKYKIVSYIPQEVKAIGMEEQLTLSQNGHATIRSAIKKWEPEFFGNGWKLSEFPNLQVIGLFKSKEENDIGYYILSESGRWYRWFIDFDNPEDIKDFTILGLTQEEYKLQLSCLYKEIDDYKFEIWFQELLRGYVFGVSDSDVTTGSETVYKLKQLAESQGKKIRTLHGGSYLSMLNNWPEIWDMLEKDRKSGVTYNNYLPK